MVSSGTSLPLSERDARCCAMYECRPYECRPLLGTFRAGMNSWDEDEENHASPASPSIRTAEGAVLAPGTLGERTKLGSPRFQPNGPVIGVEQGSGSSDAGGAKGGKRASRGLLKRSLSTLATPEPGGIPGGRGLPPFLGCV